MTSSHNFAELTDTLIRVIHQSAAIEQIPVDLGHGTLLSASEIHLIDMAGRYPNDNLKSLALRLGVTKGAISQMVKKLEEKGYITRVKAEENKKTVFLSLTISGMEVYTWHTNLHSTMYNLFREEIAKIPDSHIIATIEILSKYEQILVTSMKIRNSTDKKEINEIVNIA